MEYFPAGKLHLAGSHAAHPDLHFHPGHVHVSLLLTVRICFRAHFNPVAVNPAIGALKVGRWSRKAGGLCIRSSFCVELSVDRNGR